MSHLIRHLPKSDHQHASTAIPRYRKQGIRGVDNHPSDPAQGFEDDCEDRERHQQDEEVRDVIGGRREAVNPMRRFREGADDFIKAAADRFSDTANRAAYRSSHPKIWGCHDQSPARGVVLLQSTLLAPTSSV